MKYSSFDPWQSSKAEKRNVYDSFLAMHMEGDEDIEIPSDLAIAFKKLCAWGFINDCKTEIEDSNNKLAGKTILICIQKALETDISVPKWLFLDFSTRLDAIVLNKVKSWSDIKAFGLERIKGCRREKENKVQEVGEILDIMFLTRHFPRARNSYAKIKTFLLAELGLEELNEFFDSEDRSKPPQVYVNKLRQAYPKSSLTSDMTVNQLMSILMLDESRLEQIHRAYKKNMPEQANWVCELLDEA